MPGLCFEPFKLLSKRTALSSKVRSVFSGATGVRSLDGWGVMTLMGAQIHPHCKPLTADVVSGAPLSLPGLSAQFQGQSLVFRCSIYQQLMTRLIQASVEYLLPSGRGHLSLLGPSQPPCHSFSASFAPSSPSQSHDGFPSVNSSAFPSPCAQPQP